MATNYGTYKMITTDGTVFADKVRELLPLMPGSEILAVCEYNYTTRKYRPNTSAFEWLCEKRGQAIPQKEEEAPNEYVRMFREMCDLMDEEGCSDEERRKAVDSFLSNLPLKYGR